LTTCKILRFLNLYKTKGLSWYVLVVVWDISNEREKDRCTNVYTIKTEREGVRESNGRG
jgi:hypothetical protein